MPFQYERDSFLDDLIMDGDYEGAPRLRSRAKERASRARRPGGRRGRRARPYGELSPVQNLLLGGQAQLGSLVTGSPGWVPGAERPALSPSLAALQAGVQAETAARAAATMAAMPSGTGSYGGATAADAAAAAARAAQNAATLAAIARGSGPLIETPAPSGRLPGIAGGTLLGSMLGGPAGALLGGAAGSMLTPTVRVDPAVTRALAELRAKIDYAADQRTATDEHRTIVSQVEFRREVMRLLNLIYSKLPNGSLKNKVARTIRVLVG